jgi:hypothetical protein
MFSLPILSSWCFLNRVLVTYWIGSQKIWVMWHLDLWVMWSIHHLVELLSWFHSNMITLHKQTYIYIHTYMPCLALPLDFFLFCPQDSLVIKLKQGRKLGNRLIVTWRTRWTNNNNNNNSRRKKDGLRCKSFVSDSKTAQKTHLHKIDVTRAANSKP